MGKSGSLCTQTTFWLTYYGEFPLVGPFGEDWRLSGNLAGIQTRGFEAQVPQQQLVLVALVPLQQSQLRHGLESHWSLCGCGATHVDGCAVDRVGPEGWSAALDELEKFPACVQPLYLVQLVHGHAVLAAHLSGLPLQHVARRHQLHVERALCTQQSIAYIRAIRTTEISRLNRHLGTNVLHFFPFTADATDSYRENSQQNGTSCRWTGGMINESPFLRHILLRQWRSTDQKPPRQRQFPITAKKLC